jgi:hypothetical protein
MMRPGRTVEALFFHLPTRFDEDAVNISSGPMITRRAAWSFTDIVD